MKKLMKTRQINGKQTAQGKGKRENSPANLVDIDWRVGELYVWHVMYAAHFSHLSIFFDKTRLFNAYFHDDVVAV